MASLPENLDDLRKTLSFRGGWVVDRNTALLTVQYDALADLGEFDTHIFRWSRGRGWSKAFEVEWLASRIAVDGQGTIACLGPLGLVYAREVDGTEWFEQVDRSARGPRTSGPLRGLTTVAGRFVSCGMARRVYRRDEPDDWVAIDAGVAIDPASPAPVGLNSLTELADGTLSAVGFGGEIWLCGHAGWSAVQSPTNVVLNAVTALPDGRYLACGQLGVIVEGRGETVSVVTHGAGEFDLWGCADFGETVYFAADDRLLALRDGEVEVVKTGLGEGWTHRHLHAADGMLWSFGSRHVAATADGVLWQDMTPRPGQVSGA